MAGMPSEKPAPEHLGALIARISKGDQKALTELYDLSSPLLYGLLLKMLRKPESASEALQECFIRVWQRAETYSADKGDPMSWLIGIARYRALDVLRADKGRREHLVNEEFLLDEIADPTIGPQASAEEAEGLSRLAFCMRSLSEVQRKSVLLAYYQGYSHSELAEAMGAPLGTVKAWLRRGLSRLRACLLEP
tara:strand:+ start:3303 stop:3881 length:579 start_codon:yes stop_codon:yes gene_type:complete